MVTCPLEAVGDRRRILLDVRPRLFEDALADVLRSTGLDDVLVCSTDAADRSSMPYDAAILSEHDDTVKADVVIELGADLVARGRVTIGARSEEVPLQSPKQLLTLLDRLCPTTAARAALMGG